MSDPLRWLAPIPRPPDHAILEAHQLTRNFYAEVHHRQAFEQHCQWYAAAALHHRQELQKMQSDFNLLGWFYQRKRHP